MHNKILLMIGLLLVGNIKAHLKIYNKTDTAKGITSMSISIPKGTTRGNRNPHIIYEGEFLELEHGFGYKFSIISIQDKNINKKIEFSLKEYSPEEQDATELWIIPVDSKNPAGDFMIVDTTKILLKKEIRALKKQPAQEACVEIEGREVIIPGQAGLRGLITDYVIGEEENPGVSATAGSGSEGDTKEAQSAGSNSTTAK